MNTTFVDPLGNGISLSDVCWRFHILLRHPIAEDLRREFEETIQHPDVIFQSKVDEGAHLYYKRFTHDSWGEYYMMVAVDSSGQFVKTAFPVYNLNKGKKKIWPDN